MPSTTRTVSPVCSRPSAAAAIPGVSFITAYSSFSDRPLSCTMPSLPDASGLSSISMYSSPGFALTTPASSRKTDPFAPPKRTCSSSSSILSTRPSHVVSFDA